MEEKTKFSMRKRNEGLVFEGGLHPLLLFRLLQCPTLDPHLFLLDKVVFLAIGTGDNEGLVVKHSDCR